MSFISLFLSLYIIKILISLFFFAKLAISSTDIRCNAVANASASIQFSEITVTLSIFVVEE